jgi:hypothetical protein
MNKTAVYFILIILFSFYGVINASNPSNDCCSVILQVNNNTSALAFRRDSADLNATLRISKVKMGDKYAIVQKKFEEGYFAHVTIFDDGWSINTGSAADGMLNKRFQELGYNISKKKNISSEDMDSALDMLKNGYLQYSIFCLGSSRQKEIPASFLPKYSNYTNGNAMGHFVIKAPNGFYGLCIYNEGRNISKIGKLNSSDYLSVPNDPGFFREGNNNNITKENAIDEVIKIDGTDTWGFYRKDTISYLIDLANLITVNIYGTYDNGNLINKKSPANPDNIIFNEKNFIKGNLLPVVPGKMFIGTLSF